MDLTNDKGDCCSCLESKSKLICSLFKAITKLKKTFMIEANHNLNLLMFNPQSTHYMQ